MQPLNTQEQRKKCGAARAQVSHLIIHEMRLRGWTQRRLGTEINRSATAVSKVINGATHSQEILSKLKQIGVPEMYLFSPYPLTPAAQEKK